MENRAPQLVTKRLFLNDIEERDASLIVKWRSNPDVYKYFLHPHPLKYEEHINWYHKNYLLDKNNFSWMAVVRSSGERIGVFGIRRWKDNLLQVEVSYILAPEYQKKGYAKEALEILMEFAKEEWSCTEAVAEIHIENSVSEKFAESLGFSYVCTNADFVLYRKIL